MPERMFDALIVVVAAFSETILKAGTEALGFSISEGWRLLGAACTALLIFGIGLGLERVFGSWRFFRQHVIRDNRARLMGTWVDFYAKTIAGSELFFYAIYKIGFDTITH